MFNRPEKSPWGKIQHCDTLCPGVFLVSTASHGGTMIAKDLVAALSPAARRCGFKQGGYLCFEEDTQEYVALRELLDKGLWSIPDRIQDRKAFEDNINSVVMEYHPEYWKARQCGLEKAQTRQTAPSRCAERS